MPHIDKVTKAVFPPLQIATVLATNVKELLDGTKENPYTEFQVTINLAAIIKLLPEKYIPLVTMTKTDNRLELPTTDHKANVHGEENLRQSIASATVSVNIQEATPDSKVTRLKDKVDEQVADQDDPGMTTNKEEFPSSYVIDRVDMIAREIEKSKISDVEEN